MMKYFTLLCALAKVRITLMVTISTATGYLLFARNFTAELGLTCLGIFFAAAGSAAYNQVQEAEIDARMERTRKRPLPVGEITPVWAFFLALVMVLVGLNLLSWVTTNTVTILLLTGLCVFWYNGVYTYLKRWTAFAVIPGALVGVFPPLVGWAAAGGVLSDPAIIQLAFFLAVWQVPHFWLLLLKNGDDYAAAGLPTLTRLFSPDQLTRITGVWLLATAVCGLAIASLARVEFPWNLAFLFASLWLGAQAFRLLLRRPLRGWRRGAFIRVNIYALLVMLLLAGNALA